MTPASTTITDPKAVLTTGQVAQICHVAPRTVTKWFDSGQLRGYRIPGSRDRRIPMDQLLAFMRTHGIPLDGLDRGICRVLVIDDGRGSLNRFGQALEATGKYELDIAASDFEAGALAQQFRPHVIILSVGRGQHESLNICQRIKAIPSLQAAKVIALSDSLSPQRREELAAMGFDGCAESNYSASDLMHTLDEATNLIT